MIFALIVSAGLATGTGAQERLAPDDLAALPPADVVVLGEVHDNPVHHRNQARALAALRPAAIVFEMLTPDQAARATPARRGDAEALARALGWAESGWPDFAMYHPLFTAAPEAAIHGGGLASSAARAATEDGAAAVFARETGHDPARYGLDTPLAAEAQAHREAAQGRAHCNALPESMLPGMVEAQRLRDAALALAAIRAHAAHGGPVAVITGNGHARTDHGVPATLARAAPELSVLSVGQVEEESAAAPFDRVVVTSAPERAQDPCTVFAGDD
ncbi:hypothetical protein C2I36_00870 [Rhodobacteraceae bacterium WD3A24]|nr:hypothetical protein C2I36_00870 [Rhodobacteraceae bacterium WD3A24]